MATRWSILKKKLTGDTSTRSGPARCTTNPSDSPKPPPWPIGATTGRYAHRADLQYLRPAHADQRRPGHSELHEAGLAGRRPYGLRRRQPDPQLLLCSDEVDGILRLSRSAEHEPVNIGNPSEFTILECAQQVLAVTGSKSKIRHEPLPQDDPKQRRPDITKAATAGVGAENRSGNRPADVAGLFPASGHAAGIG